MSQKAAAAHDPWRHECEGCDPDEVRYHATPEPDHDECGGKCKGCDKPCECPCRQPFSRNEIMQLRDIIKRVGR